MEDTLLKVLNIPIATSGNPLGEYTHINNIIGPAIGVGGTLYNLVTLKSTNFPPCHWFSYPFKLQVRELAKYDLVLLTNCVFLHDSSHILFTHPLHLTTLLTPYMGGNTTDTWGEHSSSRVP